jgi:hypothetical protein
MQLRQTMFRLVKILAPDYEQDFRDLVYSDRETEGFRYPEYMTPSALCDLLSTGLITLAELKDRYPHSPRLTST